MKNHKSVTASRSFMSLLVNKDNPYPREKYHSQSHPSNSLPFTRGGPGWGELFITKINCNETITHNTLLHPFIMVIFPIYQRQNHR